MQGKHFDYLDGWRGLAIGFLLIGHFYPVPGINLGTFGVNLFFVLSGLLMSRLLFTQRTPISFFYRRRISRIFPTYFFFIAAVITVYITTAHQLAWSEVATAVLLINNYFPGDLGHTVMPFGHLWSLAVEEHSYILLSLIAIVSRKKLINPLMLVGIFCILFASTGILYWVLYSGATLDFGKWIHSEVSAYGIFISAFLMLVFEKTGVPKLSVTSYLALATLAIAMHWWSVPNPVRTIVGVGILAFLVNCLTAAPDLIKQFLSNLPLRYLGLWSYSIYIFQQPFYLESRLGQLATWVAIFLALLTGLLSFYLIEKPIRRYLNRIWSSR